MDRTGVAVMASENAAVMVTFCEVLSRLSSSVSVNVTDGGVASKVKVMLSVPAYALPAKSVPETVTV